MLHKLKQQIGRFCLTSSNRLPNRCARKFLTNHMLRARKDTPSAKLRAALGLTRWSISRAFHQEDRVCFRAACFITARARGTSRRYTVSRTRVKALSDAGQLIGARKSSW